MSGSSVDPGLPKSTPTPSAASASSSQSEASRFTRGPGRRSGEGRHGEAAVAQLLPVELRALTLAAPDPRAARVVDAVGHLHASVVVHAGNDPRERLRDVLERVVVVV